MTTTGGLAVLTGDVNSEQARPRFLFVLHQMGTLDHSVALWRQLTAAGAHADFSLGEVGLELPAWVFHEAPQVTIVSDPLEAIAERRYDGVVVQMPYDEHKSPEWSKIGPDQAYVIYSGYSVWMVEWDHGAHGLPFYQRCSLILASSPFEASEFKTSPSAPRAAVWSGDPLMWEVAQAPTLVADTPRILWTPHWTETWVDGSPGFASWKDTVHDVLSAARRHAGATFVVRGHPLMRVEGDDRRSRRAARAYRQLLALNNVELSQSSMYEDMIQSTAHLTDGVGIIAYYAMLSKPMAVVRLKKRWPPYNSAGRAIVGSTESLHTSRTIRQWLDKAARGSLHTQSESAELVRQVFPLREVSPGQVLVDEMCRDETV